VINFCSIDGTVDVEKVSGFLARAGAYVSENPSPTEEELRPISFKSLVTFQIKLGWQQTCRIKKAQDICFMGVNELA